MARRQRREDDDRRTPTNVIFPKSSVTRSNPSTKSSPRFPNSVSMAAFVRSERIETSVSVALPPPARTSREGWLKNICRTLPPAPALSPDAFVHVLDFV